MNNSRLIQLIGLTLMVVVFSIACATPQSSPTPIPPTATLMVTPTEMSRLSPSPRDYVSMAYDAESNRIILFGGQTGDYQLPSSYNGETLGFRCSR